MVGYGWRCIALGRLSSCAVCSACPSGWDGRDLACTRRNECASRAWVRGYMGGKVPATPTLLAQNQVDPPQVTSASSLTSPAQPGFRLHAAMLLLLLLPLLPWLLMLHPVLTVLRLRRDESGSVLCRARGHRRTRPAWLQDGCMLRGGFLMGAAPLRLGQSTRQARRLTHASVLTRRQTGQL